MGNYIVFFTMLDTALSQIDPITFVQSAPFLGIVPEYDKEDAFTSQKVSRVAPITHVTGKIQKILLNNHEISVASEETIFDVVACAKQAEDIYGSIYRDHSSLIYKSLKGIEEMLIPYLRSWGTEAGPIDIELLPIDRTFEFYRIWSVLLFVFVQEIEGNTRFGKSSLDLMGEGFLWAGAAIIHFLGQRNRFEAMDFGYYLIRISEYPIEQTPQKSNDRVLNKRVTSFIPSVHETLLKPGSTGKGSTDLNDPLLTDESKKKGDQRAREDRLVQLFLNKVKDIKSINDKVFDFLETYYPAKSASTTKFIYPPDSDSSTKVKYGDSNNDEDNDDIDNDD